MVVKCNDDGDGDDKVILVVNHIGTLEITNIAQLL